MVESNSVYVRRVTGTLILSRQYPLDLVNKEKKQIYRVTATSRFQQQNVVKSKIKLKYDCLRNRVSDIMALYRLSVKNTFILLNSSDNIVLHYKIKKEF